MKQHPYIQRYLSVWNSTLSIGELTEEQVNKSRFYFETDFTHPKPKEFDTYAIVYFLPMNDTIQDLLNSLWNEMLKTLNHPLAYQVAPKNRHIELILFSRPEEVLNKQTINQSIKMSYQKLKSKPPKMFSTAFGYPFITPDGTVVVPGFPGPQSVVDDFRSLVRNLLGEDSIPKQQSQWFHISLGRILEPVSTATMKPCLDKISDKWGEQLFKLNIDKLAWTYEKQWYMMKKDILHELNLS